MNRRQLLSMAGLAATVALVREPAGDEAWRCVICRTVQPVPPTVTAAMVDTTTMQLYGRRECPRCGGGLWVKCRDVR